MNTMELQSQLQLFPNLWSLQLQLLPLQLLQLHQLSNRFRLLQFKLLQWPKLLSLLSKLCPLMVHSTILKMILANTHLDMPMENLSNKKSKLLMELSEELTSMLMPTELFKLSITSLMPLDSELEPPISLSIMLKDLSPNLSKKLKQSRSQSLLLTKVSWSLQ